MSAQSGPGQTRVAPTGAAPSADLLLSHGYLIADDPHEQRIMKPYPPLGLLSLSAYLKSIGYRVAVHDPTFGTRGELHARIERREAPVLGLYTNLTTRGHVLSLIERAKAAGWIVVLGGPESAGYPDAYLAHGADAVVFGEGELTTAELLPALAAAGPHRLHDVAGIAFVDEDGAVVRTEARPKLRDLDTLPWPDREAIDTAAYVECWRTHHGAGSLNLITARGCPYRCRWCSHAVFGYHHARRSPADVAAEVSYILERWSPDQLWYADDVFSISPRWLSAYADIMSDRGLHVPFECITRADRVDDGVVDAMRRLGCFRVWIGSESGSQRVLDAMERGVTVEQVRAATRAFQAAGIEVGMFLMWGYPGERLEDIEATIEHVKRTAPDVFLTTVAYPMKGTPYFEDVESSIRVPETWAASTDRDHAVAGRHSRRYYAHASKRLRHEVALEAVRRDRPGAVFAQARAAIGALGARVGMALRAHEVEA